MKIKAVRAYQAVRFDGSELTHFIADNESRRKGSGVSITEVKNIGVKIKSDKDAVILPYANCAYIVLDESKMEQSFASQANSKAV